MTFGHRTPRTELRISAPLRPVHDDVDLSLGVASPGADDAFLAAECIALASRRIERTRTVRLDRITMAATGVGHVDCERCTSALHRYCRAVALALSQRGGARDVLGRKVISLAKGAAFADR